MEKVVTVGDIARDDAGCKAGGHALVLRPDHGGEVAVVGELQMAPSVQLQVCQAVALLQVAKRLSTLPHASRDQVSLLQVCGCNSSVILFQNCTFERKNHRNKEDILV